MEGRLDLPVGIRPKARAEPSGPDLQTHMQSQTKHDASSMIEWAFLAAITTWGRGCVLPGTKSKIPSCCPQGASKGGAAAVQTGHSVATLPPNGLPISQHHSLGYMEMADGDEPCSIRAPELCGLAGKP